MSKTFYDEIKEEEDQEASKIDKSLSSVTSDEDELEATDSMNRQSQVSI